MNTIRTSALSFRSKQTKCIPLLSCFIFCLLTSFAFCEQTKEDGAAALNDSDYTDADDIEWGNFPIAETTTKGHPVVFYKEDIVSEDYDPNKDTKPASSSKEAKSQFRRRYKDINRRNRLNRTENYRYIKPEKVYFDVYPSEYEKASDEDTKFNDDDIQVEVISLLDDASKDERDYSVHLKHKRPKKVTRHHRQRRDLAAQGQAVDNRRQKRQPTFFYSHYVPQWYGSKKKFTIKTTYINVPFSNVNLRTTTSAPKPTPSRKTTIMPDIKNRIDTDDNDQWMIWGKEPVTEMQPRRRRPLPPIIHSGDEDYMSEVAPMTTTYRPMTTSRPRPTTAGPRTTFRPTTRVVTTTTTPAPALFPDAPSAASARKELEALDPAPVGLSPCVWAVSSCCKSKSEIQYSCFEYLGCIGDFWDVNPCSPRFYKNAVDTVNNYFRAK